MSEKTSTLSRRLFTQMLGTGAASAALRPTLAAPRRALSLVAAPSAVNGVIRLSSNENPYGPSPAALRALTEAFGLAWRYPDEYADALVDELAAHHSVTRENILLGNGSGEILKLAAAALTGPGKRIVLADPTFEAIMHHARTGGAEVAQVPLTADYRHDLPKMLAVTQAGLFYICNPNNPTASLTPKGEVRAFLSRVPRDVPVLVDEAYYHYVESSDYESVVPLVKDYPNLIAARTFSKIYGMAGLRCGYCVASPALIARLRRHQTWDSVNIMALAAARASLKDAAQLEQGRQLNREVKTYLYSELDKMNYRYIPSAANFLMIDVRREVKPVIEMMRQRGVEVGRLFPSMPRHMRLTIGTEADMQAFVAAFRQVLSKA